MKAICYFIRLTGYLLGLFVLVSGVADVLGYVPHSYEMPPWTTRLLDALPAMLSGIVLLTPIKYFLRGIKYYALAAAYALVVLAAAILCVQGLTDYLAGTKDPAIVPFSAIVFAIPAANAFVLWYMRRDRTGPPNSSFKPKPLRGSA